MVAVSPSHNGRIFPLALNIGAEAPIRTLNDIVSFNELPFELKLFKIAILGPVAEYWTTGVESVEVDGVPPGKLQEYEVGLLVDDAENWFWEK